MGHLAKVVHLYVSSAPLQHSRVRAQASARLVLQEPHPCCKDRQTAHSVWVVHIQLVAFQCALPALQEPLHWRDKYLALHVSPVTIHCQAILSVFHALLVNIPVLERQHAMIVVMVCFRDLDLVLARVVHREVFRMEIVQERVLHSVLRVWEL